jgi:hypothetical protein
MYDNEYIAHPEVEFSPLNNLILEPNMIKLQIYIPLFLFCTYCKSGNNGCDTVLQHQPPRRRRSCTCIIDTCMQKVNGKSLRYSFLLPLPNWKKQ